MAVIAFSSSKSNITFYVLCLSGWGFYFLNVLCFFLLCVLKAIVADAPDVDMEAAVALAVAAEAIFVDKGKNRYLDRKTFYISFCLVAEFYLIIYNILDHI